MRIPFAVVTATLLLSSSAFAQYKQYGTAGTFEVAGSFSYGSTTSDYDDAGKTTVSGMTITPSGGFYLMDNVQILADVVLRNTTTKSDGGEAKGNLTSIGAGAGYFVAIGALRAGPQLLLRYYSQKVDYGGGVEASDTGPGATVGLAAKVPIGSGGLLIAGLNYDYLNTKRKRPKDDGTVSGYATTVGFGIYF